MDDLAGDAAVAAQIRHSTEVAQNHIGTLLGWSLARLSVPALTALQFASLLLPDEMPLQWLEWLTRQRHRLVAEHVRAGGVATHFADIDQFLDALTTQFEQQVGQADDANLRTQHGWLRDQLEHLIATQVPTQALLSSAGVVASHEGEHGSLERALDLTTRILAAKQHLLGAPDSPSLARDVSVSLERLGDFLARRGQPGDAEAAYAYFQRDLTISEQLQRANPDSAQAARDVSVSLNKLADFLARRGQPGDDQVAYGHYQRSLEVREQLLCANPHSAQAKRDVLTVLERLATAEGARPGGATRALELQMRSLQLALQLREQNPASWYFQRTAATAFFLTFRRAQAADNEQLAQQCLGDCYAVLDPLIQAGMEVDEPMRQLHAQLAPLFTPS